MEQQIRFCRAADGVRIAYATLGSGPPLVKAANWITHLEFDLQSPVWQHWWERLSTGRCLVRYDERGSGLSDWDVEDLSFEAMVRDLEAVVDALSLDRFPLFGIYAAMHPRLGNARQLREFALRAVERVPRADDRVRYDHMFDPGDPENKAFWVRALPAAEHLVNRFTTVED